MVGRTDGHKEIWVEVGDDFGGAGADEVVDVVVGDMEMLDFVGHGEGGWKDKDDKRLQLTRPTICWLRSQRSCDLIMTSREQYLTGSSKLASFGKALELFQTDR